MKIRPNTLEQQSLLNVSIIGKQANTLTLAQLEDLDKWLHAIGNTAAKLVNQISAGHGVLLKLIAENRKK